MADQAELLDLAHDLIVVRDLEDRVRYWNQRAERHYGWPADETLGWVAHDLLATQFPQPLEDITDQLLRDGHGEGELVQRRRDGTRIIVASRWTLRRNDTGQPVLRHRDACGTRTRKGQRTIYPSPAASLQVASPPGPGPSGPTSERERPKDGTGGGQRYPHGRKAERPAGRVRGLEWQRAGRAQPG